ncbi:MAG: LysM peptidoglycan-binding domain-containing M23 family metallopeptidase [Pseudomonadota bacterium]|jgi:murein DD-endopeptidase MepM/ murein hydrolase activator NlpD|nr:M23 family metallopeptidase [Alphaproteobacteria bacterium]
MNNILACMILLLLAGCATNQQPAEVVSSRKKATKTPVKSDYYLVKTGDTLASVSAQFNVTQTEILKLNKLPEGVQLVPGQRILLKARNKQEEQRLADDIVVKPLDDISQAPDISDINQLPGDFPVADASQPITGQSAMAVPGDYTTPVQGPIIKSFGMQPDGTFHKGINIAAPKGVPVRSIQEGVVKYVGTKADGYGKMVMIKHDTKEIISVYSHLNSIDVKQGAIVSAGSKIGTVGSTGGVSQPQLNLQIRSFSKEALDPTVMIPGLG